MVRKRAGIGFHGKSYPLAFFMADVRMEGRLEHDENHVWLHPGGSLAALPLPAASTWRLFVEVTGERDDLQHEITLNDIRRFMSERAPDMDAAIVGEPLWLSDFRISARRVDRMHAGRVFLAGDAAHIHSPTGGQGITTGMQDAANLAWKLARVCRGAPQALLETYDEERLPHAAEVLRETDRTTRILFAPSPGLRIVRDVLVLPILRNQWVQSRMFGKLSQLHVHYRRSSLSEDDRPWWSRRKVRAGDRAPDVAFTDQDTKRPTTLFQIMQPLRPVVLFNGPLDAIDLRQRLGQLGIDAFVVHYEHGGQGGSGLFDRHGDFTLLYGLRHNFICLIRPDGHLGFIGSSLRTKGLSTYLERICDRAEVRRLFP